MQVILYVTSAHGFSLLTTLTDIPIPMLGAGLTADGVQYRVIKAPEWVIINNKLHHIEVFLREAS